MIPLSTSIEWRSNLICTNSFPMMTQIESFLKPRFFLSNPVTFNMIGCLNITIPKISVERLYGTIPSCPDASNCTNLQCASETPLWDFETCIFHLDVLIACRHHRWLRTLMIEERHYFPAWRSNLDFFLFFQFGLLSFYSVLSYDRKMKQKEKEVYTHFILSYSLYEHQTWVFYLILRVDTFWFPEI